MKYLYLAALCAAGTMSCAETALVAARKQYTPEQLLAFREGADNLSPKAAAVGKQFGEKQKQESERLQAMLQSNRHQRRQNKETGNWREQNH